jgi:transcriptional regulator
MYIHQKFKNDDRADVFNFCDRYSFATVISGDSGVILANHFPLLLDQNKGPNGTLIGHMARANAQWKSWGENTTVLCIFNGPNRYISPKWYRDELNVPTWNYAVVHMSGKPRLIEDHEGLENILKDLVQKYEKVEGTNWSYDLPEDFRRGLTKAIVGFEIDVTIVEAKFKLSQNREDADRLSAIENLSSKIDESSQEMVRLMKANWKERF